MSGPPIAIYFVAALLGLMGVGSILAPTLTTAQFGIHEAGEQRHLAGLTWVRA